jgi:hypothetical protein
VGDSAILEAPVSTGTYDIAVLRGTAAESLGAVEVRGYGGAVQGPPLSGIIQPWPPASSDATFLANGHNQLQLVDAVLAAVVRAFPDSIHNPLGDASNRGEHCGWGPGPTYDADTFILCPEAYSRVAWDIGGDDPRLVEVSCSTAPDPRADGLIAPGYWLIGRHHLVEQVKCPQGTTWAPGLSIEQTEYIRISPRGDRILVMGNLNRNGGAPVLDAAGDIAYRIAEFDGDIQAGAGFSSDGATLYGGMWRSDVDAVRVVSVNATIGQPLAQATVALTYPADLLVDSDGGWVYVVGVEADRWALAVLDSESLTTVAVLQPADEGCTPDWPVGLVLGKTQSAVFTVSTQEYRQYPAPEPSCIQRFDVWR